MSSTPAQHYARLLQEVRRHDHLYYVQAQPEISDTAYDRLYRELLDLETTHPKLADENSPTRKVGGAPLDSFRTVAHAVRMQSLNNTYLDITEVRGGLGATYKIAANLEIEADFGYTAMRRFEYPDRNYRLTGDNVTWVSFALNTRF